VQLIHRIEQGLDALVTDVDRGGAGAQIADHPRYELGEPSFLRTALLRRQAPEEVVERTQTAAPLVAFAALRQTHVGQVVGPDGFAERAHVERHIET